MLPIPESLFYRNFRGWRFLCCYFLVVCNFANLIFLNVDKTVILFSAEFVCKLACRTGVIIIIIIIIIIIWGVGGFRRTKASAKQVRSTSHVRQGKVQKNCRPAFPCCVCLAFLARFTPDFVPLIKPEKKNPCSTGYMETRVSFTAHGNTLFIWTSMVVETSTENQQYLLSYLLSLTFPCALNTKGNKDFILL